MVEVLRRQSFDFCSVRSLRKRLVIFGSNSFVILLRFDESQRAKFSSLENSNFLSDRSSGPEFLFFGV